MVRVLKELANIMKVKKFQKLNILLLQNPSSVNRQVHAVYEKLHGEYVSQGKVFMEFLWNDPKSLFEPPPAESARAKLVHISSLP